MVFNVQIYILKEFTTNKTLIKLFNDFKSHFYQLSLKGMFIYINICIQQIIIIYSL